MDHEQEIKKLEAQIEELKAEAEAEQKAEQEAPPVWEPDFGEAYYFADSNEVSKYYYYDDTIDNNYIKVGNLFKTKQEVHYHLRALRLIETIRRERFKAQGNWWPSEGETRYTVCWNQLGNRAYINALSWELSSSVFGFWRNADVLIGVFKKYDPELWWYFTEYLPSIN